MVPGTNNTEQLMPQHHVSDTDPADVHRNWKKKHQKQILQPFISELGFRVSEIPSLERDRRKGHSESDKSAIWDAGSYIWHIAKLSLPAAKEFPAFYVTWMFMSVFTRGKSDHGFSRTSLLCVDKDSISSLVTTAAFHIVQFSAFTITESFILVSECRDPTGTKP